MLRCMSVRQKSSQLEGIATKVMFSPKTLLFLKQPGSPSSPTRSSSWASSQKNVGLQWVPMCGSGTQIQATRGQLLKPKIPSIYGTKSLKTIHFISFLKLPMKKMLDVNIVQLTIWTKIKRSDSVRPQSSQLIGMWKKIRLMWSEQKCKFTRKRDF
jgi:hypothetical protein